MATAEHPDDPAGPADAARPPTPPEDAAGPLAVALGRVGDRWTLQVVDALLAGPRRYGELQQAVPGLATSVLSARLKQLEADGLVVSSPYQERPVRLEYRLTAAGAELAGALRLLARWGADQVPGPDTPTFHHATCGTEVEARWWCPTCDVVVDDDQASDVEQV